MVSDGHQLAVRNITFTELNGWRETIDVEIAR
jgi:hypothetical protein